MPKPSALSGAKGDLEAIDSLLTAAADHFTAAMDATADLPQLRSRLNDARQQLSRLTATVAWLVIDVAPHIDGHASQEQAA